MKFAPACHRRRVDVEQQIDLFLDRHFHRVLLDRRRPRHFADALGRRELHGLGLQARIRLRDRDRLLDGARDRIAVHVAGRREAPGAVGDDAHADAGRLGVDDVLHLVFARDHELAQVPPDAHVAIRRAVRLRGAERDVGELLLGRRVHLAQQHFGRDRAPVDRQHQRAEPDAAHFHEITSVHHHLPRFEFVRGSP